MLGTLDDVRTKIERVAVDVFGWWRQENRPIELFLK